MSWKKIGVERAKKYLNNADLVIYVVDTSTALDENDHEIMELLKDRHAIVLLNKSDLSPVTTVEDIRKHLDKKMISISAKEQTGMDDLEETIKEMFFSGEVTFNDEVYITNIRHKTSLQEALRSLHLVLQSIADDMPEDFYSIDLMNAYEELGNIIGESVEDDLVNESSVNSVWVNKKYLQIVNVKENHSKYLYELRTEKWKRRRFRM